MDSQRREEIFEEIAHSLLGLFIVFLGRLIVALGPVPVRWRRLLNVFRHHHGLFLLIGGVRVRLPPFLSSALPAWFALFLLPAPVPLAALPALAALVPSAPAASSAAAPLLAVSLLLRLGLGLPITFLCVRVAVYGNHPLARQQPHFDFGGLTAESKDPGTAGINDGNFYVFELGA